jgi:hypothetical protein
MPIYRLKPIDNNCVGWRYSTYKGEVIVRASCENEARNLANLRFCFMAEVSFAREVTTEPWTQKSIVSCQIQEETSLQHDLAPEIISPIE